MNTDGNGRSQVRNYRDLMAWQKGMDMVEMVYTATREWPREELYGLTNQATRYGARQSLCLLISLKARAVPLLRSSCIT